MRKNHRTIGVISGAVLMWVGMRDMADAKILGVSFGAGGSPVYHMDEGTGTGALVGLSSARRLNSLARNTAGDFYSVGSTGGANGDNILVTIDPTSGAASLVAQLTDADIRGLAFSSSDKLYGIRNGGSTTSPDHLVTIDVNTGVVTNIGNSGMPGIQALEFSPSGILYGWEAGNGEGTGLGLITLNPATGEASDVNPIIGGTALQIQSLAFSDDGTLYGARQSLYTVNLSTGALTLVGGSGFTDIRGIGFIPIPEPASLTIVSIGCLSLLAYRSRRD